MVDHSTLPRVSGVVEQVIDLPRLPRAITCKVVWAYLRNDCTMQSKVYYIPITYSFDKYKVTTGQ